MKNIGVFKGMITYVTSAGNPFQGGERFKHGRPTLIKECGLSEPFARELIDERNKVVILKTFLQSRKNGKILFR
jgi:hypothetical protein